MPPPLGTFGPYKGEKMYEKRKVNDEIKDQGGVHINTSKGGGNLRFNDPMGIRGA